MTSTELAPVRSVESIRSAFPALSRVHRGRSVAYFDGPGGTQVPREVIEAMADYLAHHNANTHWKYPSSAETDALLGEARQAVAELLGAADAEIAFGQNMTSLTFHLARGLARSWAAGDVVIVTELDHHGNVGPWEAIAQERGIVLRRIPFDTATGTLDPDRIAAAIDSRTRLVAVGWASNALGTINDVAAIVSAARQRGVLSFVDAVHGAPHVLPDVVRLGCDFLACSAYKFYGPHLGILYGRAPVLAAVDVPKLRPAPDSIPERIETGTQSHEAIVGCRAAVDFLATIGSGASRRARLESAYRTLHERGAALGARMWNGLAGLPGVRTYGPAPGSPRTPTVAFTVDGVASSRVAERLAERAVFVSHGDFYAATVAERYQLGEEGFVRAGCACYTTAEEVDRLIEAVAEIR